MRVSRKILRGIFIVAGAFFVVLAILLKNFALISEISKDFAVVLLSIALLDMVWSAVGGDFSQIDLFDTQIKKVYLSTQDAEHENPWLTLIENATHRIDLQGLSLSYFASNSDYMKAIKGRIVAGVKMRVVIMSPNNPFLRSEMPLRSFLYPENVILASKQSAEVFEQLQDEMKSLRGQKGALVVVVNESRPMSMSIRRFDDKLFVLPYIWNRNTFNSPVYYIHGESKKLFQKYMESFEDQFEALPKL